MLSYQNFDIRLLFHQHVLILVIKRWREEEKGRDGDLKQEMDMDEHVIPLEELYRRLQRTPEAYAYAWIEFSKENSVHISYLNLFI